MLRNFKAVELYPEWAYCRIYRTYISYLSGGNWILFVLMLPGCHPVPGNWLGVLGRSSRSYLALGVAPLQRYEHSADVDIVSGTGGMATWRYILHMSLYLYIKLSFLCWEKWNPSKLISKKRQVAGPDLHAGLEFDVLMDLRRLQAVSPTLTPGNGKSMLQQARHAIGQLQ
jgi:hypothetical protein